MSKDTPEVGDVWETDLYICYIIRVIDNIVEFIFRSKPYYNDIKYYTGTCNVNFF